MSNKQNIISLIANSGIQFYTTQINLGEKSDALKISSTYAEVVEGGTTEKVDKEYSFEFPYYYAKKDRYVIKDSINPDAIEKDTGLIDEDKIRDEFLRTIREEEIFTVRARDCIEAFEGIWLPIPYFRKGISDNKLQQGPETWARMWFSKIPITERKDDFYTHNVVLAFDTRCQDNRGEFYLTPTPIDGNGSVFVCSTDEGINYNFCAREWVQEWLENEYSKRKQQQNLKKTDKVFQHIGLFLHLLKVLDVADAFPPISLHANNQDSKSLEVDLVLDLGNSRACGLLFQTTTIGQPFSFTDAVPLQIRDLTYPDKTYSDPFEMRLAFVKAKLGNDSAAVKSGNPEAFKWPSILRIGKEAARLIVINDDSVSNFTMSSPKRYLWDDAKSEFPWTYISDKQNNISEVLSKPALLAGLTEFFTSDGRLLKHAEKIARERGLPIPLPAMETTYSRGSLMIFVIIEILLHALTFVNSHKFRKEQGKEFIPRRLKRILLTCPTAMTQLEKSYLRQFAADAIESLKQFFNSNFLDNVQIDVENESYFDEMNSGNSIVIIPDPKDVLKPSENKRDWGYDEATCSQLAFVYGEIAERYQNNAQLYFNIVGKKRKDALNPNAPSVTLASIDMGGGTTDLMICNYQSDASSDITVLTPEPLFWEGFNLAGDDILRRIIERIILPVIAEEAKKMGCRNTVEVMNFLFGADIGMTVALDRMMRRQFANQIALPIAYGIVQHATEERSDEKCSFDSFFVDYPRPNQQLVDYLNAQFAKRGTVGFDITKIDFILNKEGINRVVVDVVEKMIGELCTVIAQYNCDYVLLAGRPTNLPIIRDIFLKFLPVSSDRIIRLGNYRIGKWYPFADATGRIKDPKTCVAVGATIALMGGRLNRLEGFRLNTELLRKKVTSTADFIGKYDKQHARLSNVYLTPELDNYTIQYDGPMLIGMRQMKNDDWTATPIYKLTYASYEAAEKLGNRLPLFVDIERDSNNKEKIQNIRNIVDKEGKKVSPMDLKFCLQTLADEYGYWVDTGSFNLPIF